MGIRFSVLASGSTGNATVIQHEEATLLIDAGLSAKKVIELLAKKDVAPTDLNGILITHEHSDHIKGVGALSRKHCIPVYANEKTWVELDRLIGDVPPDCRKVLETGGTVSFGAFTAESFGISHDAAEPVGYCFYDGERKLGVATDLGYVSAKVRDKLADSDVLVIEANHDTEMLRTGRYPWNIKRRILSDLGHLSNDAAGELLCQLASAKLKRVYLAHLSLEHNLLDLAKLTVNSVVENAQMSLKEMEVRLMDTYHDRATPWDVLAE